MNNRRCRLVLYPEKKNSSTKQTTKKRFFFVHSLYANSSRTSSRSSVAGKKSSSFLGFIYSFRNLLACVSERQHFQCKIAVILSPSMCRRIFFLLRLYSFTRLSRFSDFFLQMLVKRSDFFSRDRVVCSVVFCFEIVKVFNSM